MSFKATNWAVSQRGISPAAKVLLWQLADRHNPDNGCFPDQGTLARDCEMSRSTVNRNLAELEKTGLIVRERRVHPVTKKQLPTRYVLAFEDDFADALELSDQDAAADDGEESRVSYSDTAFDAENEGSRVPNPRTDSDSRVPSVRQAVSHERVEPSPTDGTRIKGLTSNLTGKVTSKARDARAQRESDFKMIWKLFPERPGSNELAAWEAFEKLDKADAAKCVAGVERFAVHFREQGAASPKSLEERLQYVKFLSNWIAEKGWIAALRLPVKAMPGTDAAKALEQVEWINKFTQSRLFEACERVKGKPVPVGSSGKWGFPKEIVAEARALLGEPATGDPP